MALSGAVASAQPLSAFLEASDTYSFEQRQARLEAERAAAAFGEHWGSLLPSVRAGAGWTYNQFDAVISVPDDSGTARTITIVPRNQLDAQLRLEVPVIDASRWMVAASAAATAEAAELERLAAGQRVRRAVVADFHQWVAARGVVASAQRSLEVARRQLAQLEARQGAGVATDLELERARAEVERATQILAEAEVLETTQARALKTLTGLEPTQPPQLPAEALDALLPLERLETSLFELPQLRAAESLRGAAERATAAAALALVPSVNAQFTQRFTNATGFQNTNALYSTGLELAWKLDVATAQALRRQQRSEALSSLTYERLSAAARDQLHSDWHRTRAALVKVKAAEAQLVAARRARDLTDERRQAGVATQLEAIQADRDVFAAEVGALQARCELGTARRWLKLSAGLPLEEEPR